MIDYKKHLIKTKSSLKVALSQLSEPGIDAILFVVDTEDKLLGSITDGDVRRGLVAGIVIDDLVDKIIRAKPKHIIKGHNDLQQVIAYREEGFRIIPVLDNEHRIINIINFRFIHSYLPVDAILMGGGKGQRLWPLTEKTPKPLLPVGGKSIIKHNLDRLMSFGIDNFWISINYLGEQIEKKLGDGSDRNVKINYVREKEPLGTIGAISKIKNFQHEHILVSNSDILTNLDYEDFYLQFLKEEADMAIVTIPYQVNIPYAVMETENGVVTSFKEKPTFTYYSNGGIYLIKKSVLALIPAETFFNATDLMERLITDKKKVLSYPMVGYWLDIGNHEDYKKANLDITRIKF
jgi:dTDP-glucose pyrophosphorylase